MEKKSIAELIKTALEAGLMGLDFLRTFTLEELERGYNGIGPEFLPAIVREKISDRLSLFAPAAVIHDMRNDVSDGSRTEFLAANREFLFNCLALVDHAYPNDCRKRDRALTVAFVLYRFVNAEKFGWRAWLEAHERYLSRQGLRPSIQRDERC